MRIVFPFTFKRKNLLEYSKRHGILTKCSWGLFFPFTFKRNNLVEYSKRLVRRLSSGTDGEEQVCPSCAPRFFHRLGVSNSGRLPNNLDYPGRQLRFLMIMAEVVLVILYLFYSILCECFRFSGKARGIAFRRRSSTGKHPPVRNSFRFAHTRVRNVVLPVCNLMRASSL